jgi:hypothetical protein
MSSPDWLANVNTGLAYKINKQKYKQTYQLYSGSFHIILPAKQEYLKRTAENSILVMPKHLKQFIPRIIPAA